MLIVYGNQELWNSIDPAQFAKEIEAFDASDKRYCDTGELLGAHGVADAAATRLVKVPTASPRSPTGPTWRPRST
jgi:hypothetical protein